MVSIQPFPHSASVSNIFFFPHLRFDPRVSTVPIHGVSIAYCTYENQPIPLSAKKAISAILATQAKEATSPLESPLF